MLKGSSSYSRNMPTDFQTLSFYIICPQGRYVFNLYTNNCFAKLALNILIAGSRKSEEVQNFIKKQDYRIGYFNVLSRKCIIKEIAQFLIKNLIRIE